MTISIRSAIKIAALGGAMLPILVLANVAQAEELRVKVGDLSQPTQTAAFAQRLDAAARSLCADSADGLIHGDIVMACKQAVREEALAQLTPTQRAALAADDQVRLAGAGHQVR
jgi:UrcA family protein